MAAMKNPFCVIGSTVYNSNRGNRTMLATIEEASDHGQCLLRQDGNNKPGKQLYIVQVVGVVEVPQPSTSFRLPDSSDDARQNDDDCRVAR